MDLIKIDSYKIYGQNEWGNIELIDTIHTDCEDHADHIVDVYKEEFTDSWTIWHEKTCDKPTESNILIEEEMIL
jgi:hypothetical protein